MRQKTAKVIAIIIAVLMLLSSFSIIMFVPGATSDVSPYAYGAVEEDTASEKNISEIDTDLDVLHDYLLFIYNNYKDEVSYEDLINGAFSGAIDSLGDKYSVYYSTTEESQSFTETATGNYTGVGVTIRSTQDGCTVVSVLKNGPAYNAGIKTDDIITKVDGEDMSAKDNNYVSTKLKGSVGTTVRLTIKRDGAEHSYTLTREEIKLQSVYYQILSAEDLANSGITDKAASDAVSAKKIGYIEITNFDDDTDSEFEAGFAALIAEGAQGFIIDIRDNPGGVVSAAVGVADQLISSKTYIMHYMQRGKVIESVKASGSGNGEYPVVLLVNENSASSSEILAAALKENKAATLVGSTTYGKGIAQKVIKFSNGTTFKLSTYYFGSPMLNEIQGVGVTPDYAVKNLTGGGTEELIAAYGELAPMSEQTKPSAGSTGLNVYGAQQRLSMLGYSVSVSGTMEQNTVNAVKKFQSDMGLYAYGTLDYTTMSKLQSAAYDYAYGKSNGDKQLEKAIELLK